MRIHKAIENIQAAIDRHQDEWLKDNGYEPEEHVRRKVAEPAPVKKPKPSERPRQPKQQFAANRFLGETPAAPSPEPEQELEQELEAEQVEVVSVIKNQKDEKQSWLYNEVLKAINDAAENNKGTKIIAVLIPVVQNGEEFKNLPVEESVTLSPVIEDDVNLDAMPLVLSEEPEEIPAPIDEAEPIEEPVTAEEPEPEDIQEDIQEEAKPEIDAEIFAETTEPMFEPEPELEPEAVSEETEPELEPMPEPEPMPDTTDITEPEYHIGDILSGKPENPEELQDIFRTMEEKLEESQQTDDLPDVNEAAEELQPEEPITEEMPAEEEPSFEEVPSEAPETQELPAEDVQEFLPEDNDETEEEAKFANELVDSIMEEVIEDTQEEQNVDFDDLESEPAVEESLEPEDQRLHFTEIFPIEEAKTEEIKLDEPASPAEDTEDDEFNDTETLSDTDIYEEIRL